MNFKNKSQNHVEKSVQNILLRLAKLTERIFNVRVDYLFFGQDLEATFLKTFLEKNTMISLNAGDYFAIRPRGELLGAVHVNRNLSLDETKKMQQMIELIVESTLYSAIELCSLDSLEQKMNLLESSSNVIPMDQYIQRRAQMFREAERPERRGFHSATFEVIIDSNPKKRFAEAHDIHEDSQRYAFLPLKDLSSDTFNSIESFCELGSITVYVPNIAELQAPLQKFFADYLSIVSLTDLSPCIIFGATKDLCELQTQIEPQLFSHFTSPRLDPLNPLTVL
ncbi:MAG: hypothetical protein KDD34_00985 [Bdellovibrionales bacterium]|nr:hypothetical protein [Bdellovibrionales bacterium]